MIDQIVFHLSFLFNRLSVKAILIVLIVLIVAYLDASGIWESRLIADGMRYEAALRYQTEGFQLIKIIVAVMGMLTATQCFIRPNSRYVVYLIENSSTKLTTGISKIIAVVLAVSLVFVLATCSFIGIGCIVTTYFDWNRTIQTMLFETFRVVIWFTLFQCLVCQAIGSLFSLGIGVSTLWFTLSMTESELSPDIRDFIINVIPFATIATSEISIDVVIQKVAVLMILFLLNVVAFWNGDVM